jgi:PAS domain S-box-containing protein
LNARTIAAVDGQRQDGEEALRRANESLEARVVEKTAQLAESRAVAAESAEMFFQLFEFAPDALIAVDSTGRIDRTNIRALELFGYERSDLLGQPVEILIPERFANRHTDHRSAFLKAPHAKTVGAELEIAGRRKDGTEFPVEIVLSPANSPHGPLVLAVIHDLTERRRTEALTRAAEERIQTGQRMEALGQLAGGVAHDFNNMMTVVTGYSELLLARTPEEHPSRKALEEIKKAGDRCANLTGHLLAFSRRQVLTPAVLDLGSIVTDLNQMMPVLLGENVEVHLSVEPNVWHVRTDQAQIEQVIVNLVVNARDAMPRGGKLGIAVWNREVDSRVAASHPEMAAGSYVVVSVADTGHGMDEHTRARVFDPFFTTKPVGQGSGLGLSTAYGFIKQSGGHIYLDSQLDSGTTVHVYLPRAESTAASPAAQRVRTPAGGSETILLAEDEASVRSFVRDVLGQAGYRLLEAADGRSALQLAAAFNGPIHLLISDVVMPGMNGGDLAETLMAGRPRTRTLLISGYVQQLVDEVAVSRSGVEFLRKPFTANDLLTRVREILDARGTA